MPRSREEYLLEKLIYCTFCSPTFTLPSVESREILVACLYAIDATNENY